MSRRGALAGLLAATLGCSSHPVERTGPVPDLTVRGPIVARVGGDPVGADEVAAAARDLHVTPQEAMRRVVDQHLLVAEARRQGMMTPIALRDYQWRARLQLLLEREVEAGRGPESVTAAEIADALRVRAVELDPGPTINVVHFLVHFPGAGTPADHAQAMATAAAFRQRLVAASGERPTAAQFEAAVRATRVPDIVHESVGPFDEQGRMARGGLVAEFAQASWALSGAAPLSQPFETSFGVHVVLLVAEYAARHRPAAEVEATVRNDLSVAARSEAGQALFGRARATHRVVVNREVLSSVLSLGRQAAP